MDKEYRFSVILADQTGVFLIDYGKFRGCYEIFTSVMNEFSTEELSDMAKIYMVKSNTAMTKEMDKTTNIAKDHIGLASLFVAKAIKEDSFKKRGMDKVFNKYYASTEKPYMRAGLTISTKTDGITMFVTSDKEVIGMQSLFLKVFDARKKRARKCDNVVAV